MGTETKHTPGPWTQDSTSKSIIWGSAADGSPRHVADVPAYPGRVHLADRFSDATYDEGRANARLIAAAPEMLAALREAEGAIIAQVRAHSLVHGTQRSLEAVRAAIAKAEGRS